MRTQEYRESEEYLTSLSELLGPDYEEEEVEPDELEHCVQCGLNMVDTVDFEDEYIEGHFIGSFGIPRCLNCGWSC